MPKYRVEVFAQCSGNLGPVEMFEEEVEADDRDAAIAKVTKDADLHFGFEVEELEDGGEAEMGAFDPCDICGARFGLHYASCERWSASSALGG